MSYSSIKLSSRGAFSYHWNKGFDNGTSCFIRTVNSVVGFFKGLFGGYAVSKADIDSFLANDKNKGCIFYKECSKKKLLKRGVRQAIIQSNETTESKGTSVEKPLIDKLEKLITNKNVKTSDKPFSKDNLNLLGANDSLRLFNSALANGSNECKKIALRLLPAINCDEQLIKLSGPAKANALSLFAGCGLVDLLKALLNSGTEEINDLDSNGCCTPLTAAVYAGKIQCIELLVSNGANLNKPNSGGWTPLRCAIDRGFEKYFTVLLDAGANVNEVDSKGISLLFYAIGRRIRLSFLNRLLCANGLNLNMKDSDGNTLLHRFATGKIDVLESLNKKTICDQISKPNDKGYTAFHFAVAKGNLEFVRFVLKKVEDIEINVADLDCGYTALHWAAENGDLEAIEMLLGVSGINVDILDKKRRTPMDILKSKDGCGKCISVLEAYQKQKKETEEVQDKAQGTEQDRDVEEM